MTDLPVGAALDFCAALGEIKWRQTDVLVLTSECGRWQISKAFVDGVPKYTAWKLAPYDLMLGVYASAAEAKAACR